MKVITQEAIESAQACVRSLVSQHCPVDENSSIGSLLMYDESTGLVLRPSHIKHGDGYGILHGEIQASCTAVVKWTEIDDPKGENHGSDNTGSD